MTVLCRAQIPGCARCQAEAEYDASKGHECLEPSEKWTSWCDLTRKWREKSERDHEVTHKPVTCERCGFVISDRTSPSRDVVGVCRSGQCQEWRCAQCNAVQGSAGPVTCWACSGYRSTAVSRMRTLYRQKKRRNSLG